MQGKEKVTAKAGMLIRRPTPEVFQAFVDPTVTGKFWFTKGSGRLEAGKRIRWEWEMYGISEEITVKSIEPNRTIRIEWPGHGSTNTVEWSFVPKHEGATWVEITESGFAGGGAELIGKVADSTGGFNLVLAGLKAWLEHGIRLNLVADRFPDGPPRAPE
jgi:uncharacterized protein YndB with AHSA1/START domain